MSIILRVVALVLFLLAGISALSDSVNINEAALVAFGLAAWVASTFVSDNLP